MMKMIIEIKHASFVKISNCLINKFCRKLLP